MVWNPLSPNGLWSNPTEVHLTLVGLVVGLVVVALDRHGHRHTALLALFVAFLASMGLWSRGIAYKAWYLAVPLALVGAGYLLSVRRRCPE